MKPAATAFAVTVRWLEGAKMSGCSTSGEVWICSMKGVKGDTYSIAWSAGNSEKRIKLSSIGNPKEMEFIDGTRQTVKADGSGEITIGLSPVRFIP